MDKKKLLTIILIIFLISLSLSNIAIAKKQNNIKTQNVTPIIDLFRNLKIDFKPPEIIQDCGSSFFLNVTFNKTKLMNFPRLFSATIFLKIKEGINNKIIRIGSQPFIHIPSQQLSKTVSIPCMTTNNLLTNIYCMRSGRKNDFTIRNAEIGVKIERIPHWIIFDHLLWKTIVANDIQKEFWFWVGDNLLWGSFQNDNFFLDQKPVIIFRLFSLFQQINSMFKEKNPLIVWRDTKVVSPFICSRDIYISFYRIDKISDKNGDFYVQVNISHNLTKNFNAGVLIDMADQPIINTLIPTLKVTRYNVGYFETKFTPGEGKRNYINKSIKCSFPNEGFDKKKYNISIFLGPFIHINGTSQFGRYFFNLRWMLLINPFYVVDSDVRSAIEKLWYNTPIFFGDLQSPMIFQSKQGSILYGGETPTRKIFRETKEIIEKNYFQLLILIFSFLLPIVVFTAFVNWIVRKKS